MVSRHEVAHRDVAEALALLDEDAANVVAAREKLQHALAHWGEAAFLSSGEAAQLLGVRSKNTVKAWLRMGYIKGRQVGPGGRWLIPVSEIERIRDDAQVRAIKEADRLLDEVAELGDPEGPSDAEMDERSAIQPPHAS